MFWSKRADLRLPWRPRPLISLGRHTLPAYQVFGMTGVALGALATGALTLALGLSLWVWAALTAVAFATFLALAMVTKIIVGHEILAYYHQEVAILAMAALLLALLGQPVLPYLDLTILGVGVVLVCGRFGCLSAGCCYGRPHRWGLRYGAEHVAAGFDPHLAGVRLFPTQLVEAAWVAVVVLIGCTLVLTRQPPGSALAWYIVAYDLARFGLEFLRGDSGRGYLLGFSEPQWISLGLLSGVVVAGRSGYLPQQWWHSAALAAILAVMLAAALRRRGSARHRLLAPRHIAEVAAALGAPQPRGEVAEPIVVRKTSQGLLLSAGQLLHEGRQCAHYALSCPGTAFQEADARAVAGLIMCLRHPEGRPQLLPGSQGVFHLIVEQP